MTVLLLSRALLLAVWPEGPEEEDGSCAEAMPRAHCWKLRAVACDASIDEVLAVLGMWVASACCCGGYEEDAGSDAADPEGSDAMWAAA